MDMRHDRAHNDSVFYQSRVRTPQDTEMTRVIQTFSFVYFIGSVNLLRLPDGILVVCNSPLPVARNSTITLILESTCETAISAYRQELCNWTQRNQL